MIIIQAQPPNYNELDRVFNIRGRSIVFAWGDTIYNPDGGEIAPWIAAHEAVHGARQMPNIEGWWRRYIYDPEFRLHEEIPAHRAEYRTYCQHRKDRNAWARELHHVAGKLSGALYGSLITPARARALLIA